MTLLGLIVVTLVQTLVLLGVQFAFTRALGTGSSLGMQHLNNRVAALHTSVTAAVSRLPKSRARRKTAEPTEGNES